MSCKCGTPKQYCRRVDTVRIDNHSVGDSRPLGPGIVAFPQDDHVAEYVLSNGVVIAGIAIPATGQGTWPAWNEQHAGIFAPLVGKTGFRASQPADGNPATAWANHAAMECCPGDVTIVSATLTVVGGARDGRVVPLLVEHDKGEVEKFTACVQCDPTKTVWRNDLGEVVPEPEGCLFADCQFPADAMFPAPTDCSIQTLGPLCSFDGEDTENPVDTGIFLDVEDCGGARTRILYTLPDGLDGDPVIYEPGELNVRNCDGSPVVEPPAPDCEDFELATFYRLDGVTGAMRNREWSDAFTTAAPADRTTDFGANIRNNHDQAVTPTVETSVTSLFINDTDNTAALGDVQIVDGFLIATEPTYLRWTTASEGYLAVLLGECCGPLVVQDELGKSSGVDTVGPVLIPAGIHAAEFWNIDSSGSNSSWPVESSTDGQTWTNGIGSLGLSETKPVESCLTVKVCKDTGALIDVLTGEMLDAETLTTCPQTCSPAASPAGECFECVVDGCESGFAVTVGSLNNAAEWILELADGRTVTGQTYAEFSANMAAAGFTEYIGGPNLESHRFCPYIPGTLTVVSGGSDTVTELVEISGTEDDQQPDPVTACVTWTAGKNDARIIELLEQIVRNTDTQLVEDCDGNVYNVTKSTGEVVGGPFKAPETQVAAIKEAQVGAIKTAVKATLAPRVITPVVVETER